MRKYKWVIICFVIFIFILVCLGIVFWKTGFFQKKAEYQLIAEFKSISGLRENDPVWYSGRKVGYVKKIQARIPPKTSLVTFVLTEDLKVPYGSEVNLRSEGLFGQKYLEITFSESTQYLESGDTISGKGILSLGEIIQKTGNLLSQTEELINDLKLTLTDLRLKVTRIEKNTNKVLGTSEELAVNLNKLVGKVNQKLDTLPYNDFKEMIVSIDSTVENINNFVRKLDFAVSQASDSLFNKDFQNNLQQTIKNLKEVSEEIKKHPWKLIRKK